MDDMSQKYVQLTKPNFIEQSQFGAYIKSRVPQTNIRLLLVA